jgi:hypothetical protein
MKKIVTLFAGLAALGLSGSAMAHGFTKPQHGGVVMMNGETLFELVAQPAGVSVYMIDEDEPVNAAAMTARLSIAAGGKRTDAEMVPLKGNQFFAKGVKLAKGASVGVQVTDKASQARYGATFLIK